MRSNGKKIKLGFNAFSNEACANIDYKYGPYNSTTEAFSELTTLDVLAVGLTVGINTSDGVEEYWFKSACTSASDLVLKSTKTAVVDSLTSTSTTDALSANQGNVLLKAITTEASRASSAEQALTTTINTEVSRAKSAENTNANAISAETTKANKNEEITAYALNNLDIRVTAVANKTAALAVDVANLGTSSTAISERKIGTLSGGTDVVLAFKIGSSYYGVTLTSLTAPVYNGIKSL